MGANSRIEWTDHTFNPWWGCTKVSTACDNCYAEAWAKRTGYGLWGAKSDRRFLSEQTWQQPHRWNNAAMKKGTRARVFCASMADVFELRQDLDAARQRLWRLIEETPSLDWLLLTKRPHLVSRLVPWGRTWPGNVWLGVTVETQKLAEKRIPKLVAIPARIRFLSCEPLLGALNLDRWIKEREIHWVIAGGESGPRARPSNPDWFRTIRNQCLRRSVPFHFKQWGDWAPNDVVASKPNGAKVLKQPGWVDTVVKFGKKRAGRTLDGAIWDEFPALAANA